MAKQVTAQVKIQITGGSATPAPPVGTALGPHGINLGQFVMQFNEKTRELNGMVVPVVITIFEDRSFTFVLKTPPTSVLIKQAAGLPKGSQTPSKAVAGSITDAQVTEIAQVKMPDLNANDLEAARLQVAGTARSMGIEIR